MRSGSLRRATLRDLVLAREQRSHGGRAAPAAERQAQLPERDQVAESVTPQVQLALADALPVVDRHLETPDLRVREGQDLELLRERHAVALRPDALQDVAPEDPHSRLRVDQEAAEEQHRRARQDRVAEQTQRTLRLVVLRPPPTGGHERQLPPEAKLQQPRT